MISVGNIVYTGMCDSGDWYIEEILNIKDNTVTVRPILNNTHNDYSTVNLSEYTSGVNKVVILSNSETEARNNHPEYFI